MPCATEAAKTQACLVATMLPHTIAKARVCSEVTEPKVAAPKPKVPEWNSPAPFKGAGEFHMATRRGKQVPEAWPVHIRLQETCCTDATVRGQPCAGKIFFGENPIKIRTDVETTLVANPAWPRPTWLFPARTAKRQARPGVSAAAP